MHRFFNLLVLLISLPVTALAYNNSYEQRISKQLLETYSDDEIVHLRASSRDFLALYKQYTTPEAAGAVILVHGMGGHPDWPDVIHPLRLGLPDLGWATLSIQAPVLSPDEPIANYGRTLADTKMRIQAAVERLKAWDFSSIVVIGHSFGAASAADALSANDMKSVSAYVAISVQAPQFLSPRLKLLKRLEEIQLPILDIYGSRDVLEVLRQVDDRRLATKKSGNISFKQSAIEGADHYFRGLEEVLIKQIHGWLRKLQDKFMLSTDDSGVKQDENGGE